MNEAEIMKDFYKDKYTDAYCRRQKCRKCDGFDYNGEPNGYWCIGLDKRVETMYKSILKRRMKKLQKKEAVNHD